MRKFLFGYIFLHDSVDITDPCYDRDKSYRLNDIPICDGTYRCYVWTKEETYHDKYVGTERFAVGTRIAGLGISLGDMPKLKDMKRIGEIGVDAGLAGIFKDKPDFDDLHWNMFCDGLHGFDAFICKYGAYSSSGYGDGEYDVYAALNADGKATALYIKFI